MYVNSRQGEIMSFDSSITETIQSQMETMLELVSDSSSQSQTAGEVESQIWQNLLAMGHQLMQLFFKTQEKDEERQKTYEVDGVAYRYRGQRQRQYQGLRPKSVLPF